jgi:hypothetical protein
MSKDKEITFKLTAQGAELAINALDKVGGTRHLVNYLEAQYREQMQPPVVTPKESAAAEYIRKNNSKEIKKK